MSGTRKDGGPAFPTVGEEWDADAERWRVTTDGDGLTVRDYFAAKALTGVIQMVSDGKHEPDPGEQRGAGFIASSAYRIADAMLKARQS